METERRAAELEITVDYYIEEFLDFDMEFELSESERKQKDKQELDLKLLEDSIFCNSFLTSFGTVPINTKVCFIVFVIEIKLTLMGLMVKILLICKN